MRFAIAICVFLATLGTAAAAAPEDLISAIRVGDADEVEALLRAGADPNRPSEGTSAIKGHPPLLEAALIGNTEIIRLLLDAGAEIDAEYLGGHRVFHTALSYAAHNGNIASVRALLRAGADPGRLVCAYYYCGNSLTMAALSRDPDTVRAFIEETGAEPGLINLQGLDDAYAEMTNPDSYDRRYALLPPLHAAYTNGNWEMVKLLLSADADRNRLDNWGRRASELARPMPKVGIDKKAAALVEAVERDDVAQIAALLADGADPNIATMDGRAPLLMAVAAGNVEMVRTLLAGGADPERPLDGFPKHPIHMAIRKGHTEIVRLLVEAGADIHAEWIDQLDGKRTTLSDAIEAGLTDLALELIEKGADTNATVCPGEATCISYLDLAAWHGNIKLVRKFIELGNAVDPHPEWLRYGPNGYGSLLIIAARRGDADIIAVLLENGADLSLRDGTNCAALDYAIINKRTKAAELLREAGSVADEASCGAYRSRK